MNYICEPHAIIPDEWKRYSFILRYRCCTLEVSVDKKMVRIKNLSDSKITLYLYNRELEIDGNQDLINNLESETPVSV